MKHRPLWLFVILALSLVCPAHARLTEKEDDLVKRFGQVVSRLEQNRSFEGRTYWVGTRLSFRSDQWSIDVLMVDGRCAEIRYGKVGSWTSEQIIGLLDRNGGSAGYKEEKTGLGPSYRKWKQGDGVAAVFSLNRLTLTHPMLERRFALLKAKAEAESKRPPKF
jgi:hypothetical protein